MNSSTNKEIVSALGLQNIDALPTPIAVVNVNPKDYKNLICKTYKGTTTVGGNVLVFSSTRKTIIKSLHLAYSKNAACDIATGSVFLNLTANGVGETRLALPCITLTAENAKNSIYFDNGLEINKGTSLYLSCPFTAGVCAYSATVTYYELDDYEA